MATKSNNIIAKVVEISYKSTTYVGNPVYWVDIETLSGERLKGYTKPNAAIGYYIDNSLYKNFCEISYHYTKSGAMVLESAKIL